MPSSASKIATEDRQNYCTKCQSLTGTLNGLKAACSEEGYSYWSSKFDLKLSSEKCAFCRLVWEARSWRSTKLSGSLQIHALLENLNFEEASSIVDTEHPLRNSALSGFHVKDSGQPNRARLVDLYVCTEQDNPASTVIRRRPVLTDVGGVIALQQMRTWLSTCQKLHTQCARSRKTLMPTRILNVGRSKTNPYICLQSTKGKIGSYIALSYCWGPLKQPTTSKSNLASRKEQIVLKELPQTIQDAVYIARNLDVRFLWVDALCIIHDDEDDKGAEIQEMGRIYKNSLLTVAASSSSSVMDGFLHKRDEPSSVHLPIQLPAGIFGSFRLAKWQIERVYDDPLHRRGWTFQEYLLSRRMLLFSKHEVLWRCSTHQLVPVRRSHLSYSTYFKDLPVQIFGIPAHPRQSIQKQQTEIWTRMVQEYSSRKLSKSADKINALVGIATELSAIWNDVYLLGLWSKTFIPNLAWSRVPQQEVPSERLLPNAPTWSWLSADCHTQMWPLLCIEDASIAFHQHDLLPIMTYEDLIDDGVDIRVNARVIEAFTFIERARTRLYFVYMDLDESKTLANDTIVALLGYEKNRRSALCLILRSVKRETFERVGFLRIWEFDWEVVQLREIKIV